MRIEARILILLGLFFGIMCAVYWPTSNEDGGSVMMFGAMLLGFLPGGYYYYWSRRMKPRPEDRDATQEEGSGFVGAFPSTSIFPFLLGIGAWFVVLAIVFGIWLLIPGLALVLWAFIGGTHESRRGGQR
jgi:hypothetical protein